MKNSKIVCARYCTVQESLKVSLKQMHLIREGKLKRHSWKEVRKNLKRDTNL